MSAISSRAALSSLGASVGKTPALETGDVRIAHADDHGHEQRDRDDPSRRVLRCRTEVATAFTIVRS
jgi:hypothetical protein